MTDRIRIVTVLILLVSALSVRLLLALYESEVGVDSVHYILMGDSIARGDSWDTWNTTGGRWTLPPSFPLMIALFRILGAGKEWAGHLASVFSGTLLVFCIYLLTLHLYGKKTGIAAGWIAAFTPILVDYSVVILTECLFSAFVLLMMLFIHSAQSEKGAPGQFFLSGLFCGLAFLTKTFGIFLLPFLLAGCLFCKPKRPSNKLANLFLALIGFLLLAIPYWLALRNYTGHWVIDGKGIEQENRLYARTLDEERVDPRYTGQLTPDGSDFLINDISYNTRPEWATPQVVVFNFVKKYAQKLVRIYQDFPFTPTYPNNVLLLYLFPAMLLGIGIFRKTDSSDAKANDRFLLYWLCPFIFALPLIFIEVRYYVPVVPLLIPFMALGCIQISENLCDCKFSKTSESKSEATYSKSFIWVIVIFILLAMPKLTYKITHSKDPWVSYNPRKTAAEWLVKYCNENQISLSETKIMEYGHSVSFYADTQSILIPDGDLESVLFIAKKYNARFLSLDEFYLLRANRRPQLNYLFETEKPPPVELERIYVDNTYSGLRHIIYRLPNYDQ